MEARDPENASRAAKIGGLLRRLARAAWRSEGSLAQKTVRSSFWVYCSNMFSGLATTVQTIVLVRLLAPADFGLMGIAGIVLGLMQVLSQTGGVGMAVIQKKEVRRETLNTAWTIAVVRGMILYAAIFLVAPATARYFDNPLIAPILRVVSLRLLIVAFQNIGLTLLRKELDFRKNELLGVTVTLFSVAVTIVAGFVLRSVWALVIGHVVAALAKLIGSFVVHPYRPRPQFVWAEAKALLGFGVFIWATGIVVFLKQQMDRAVVGKMLDVDQLGFYVLACGLSNLPATWITRTTSDVLFCTYSKIQTKRRALGAVFLKVFRLVGALLVPTTVGLFILAPQVVEIVYGTRYTPMLPAFRVLCIYGLLRAFGGLTSPVFKGVGKPYILFAITAGNVIAMACLLLTLIPRYQLVGAAWATTIPSIAGVALCFVLVAVITRCGMAAVIVSLAPFALASAAMGAIVHYAAQLFGAPTILGIVALTLIGAASYFAILFLCFRTTLRNVVNSIRQVFSRQQETMEETS